MKRTNGFGMIDLVSRLVISISTPVLVALIPNHALADVLVPPTTADVRAGHWCSNCIQGSLQGAPYLADSWYDQASTYVDFSDTASSAYSSAAGGFAPEVTAGADGRLPSIFGSASSVAAAGHETFYFAVLDPNGSTAPVTMSGVLETNFGGPPDGGFGTTVIGDSTAQADLIGHYNVTACAGYDACSSFGATPAASGSHPFSTDLVLQTNTVYAVGIFSSVNADFNQYGNSSATVGFTVDPSCTGCSIELFSAAPEPSYQLIVLALVMCAGASRRLQGRSR